MNSLLLSFGHVYTGLFVSYLGDTNSQVVIFQSCVDVHM